ncbi:MAG TPA: HPF/RaiA family ribosome-associated protein [Gemmatimonadales bacterium]|nr:HPF/RaiA family ribosome-associated protein [Gemmatimonadales bacterium]
MQLPLQIAARGIELGDETEALIRRYVEKLERFYDRIMSVRVMVEVPQRRMGEPIMHNVRFDVTVPGGEVLAKRQANPVLQTAIQRAYEATRRRLQDYARRQRGDVKARAGRPLERGGRWK